MAIKYLNSFLDRPIITFFECRTFKNILQLTCFADGLPEPTYTILTSNGKELAEVDNGMVIITDHNSTFNESYTCIAKNEFGQEERRSKPNEHLQGKTWIFYTVRRID